MVAHFLEQLLYQGFKWPANTLRGSLECAATQFWTMIGSATGRGGVPVVQLAGTGLETKEPFLRTALCGDAGNRTPVRSENHQDFYILSLLLQTHLR